MKNATTDDKHDTGKKFTKIVKPIKPSIAHIPTTSKLEKDELIE